MSEDYIEPSSDSFWEIGQFKRTVKRCEEGYRLCNDIVQMISERADIEKSYSKNLKSWSKKWHDFLNKGNEYGSMRATWASTLNEADRLADIHLQTHNALNDELNNQIKKWQKDNYIKSIVNQLKIAKEYEEEFKKAQKPWSKKYTSVEKTKKEYHSACKSFQSARVQFSNSQNDNTISPEQKKKLEDKVEKYKKEVEITKSKYMHALDELNSYNSRYIEDMSTVYKKCDTFEKSRLDFFIDRFLELHSHLNIYEKMNIKDIYEDFLTIIKQTSPEKDLLSWSKEYGVGMGMNWPVFEEYSEELKTIAKGRASKLTKDINADSNGVTLASIKHKSDDISVNHSTINATSESLDNRSMSVYTDTAHRTLDSTSNKINTSNHQSISNNSKESIPNPFGEYEDEEEEEEEVSAAPNAHNNTNGNKTNGHGSPSLNEDHNHAEQVNYLNVKVKALYDYAGAEDDELTFKAGEEFIKLANEDDRGWCLGKIGSKIGLYPATYAAE